MQAEKIKLQCDVPVTVLLDSAPEGEQKPSSVNGVEYKYSVNQGAGVLYLPLAGRDAILRTHAQPGDLLQILKTMRGRAQFFSAEVLSDAAEANNPHTVSGRASRPSRYPARTYTQPLPHASAPQHSNGHQNGNAHPRAQAPALLPQANEDGLSFSAHEMKECMFDAVDVIEKVQQYMRQKGVVVDFADIRALGLSMFINQNQRATSGGSR